MCLRVTEDLRVSVTKDLRVSGGVRVCLGVTEDLSVSGVTEDLRVSEGVRVCLGVTKVPRVSGGDRAPRGSAFWDFRRFSRRSVCAPSYMV